MYFYPEICFEDVLFALLKDHAPKTPDEMNEFYEELEATIGTVVNAYCRQNNIEDW